MFTGIHPKYSPHASDVQHSEYVAMDNSPNENRRGTWIVYRCISTTTGNAFHCWRYPVGFLTGYSWVIIEFESHISYLWLDSRSGTFLLKAMKQEEDAEWFCCCILPRRERGSGNVASWVPSRGLFPPPPTGLTLGSYLQLIYITLQLTYLKSLFKIILNRNTWENGSIFFRKKSIGGYFVQGGIRVSSYLQN